VPPPPARPDRLRGRVFRGSRALSAGLLSKDQLRSSAWRRLRRDVYADAELAVDHLLLVRAVRLVAPRDAVFGGLTAAYLWGATELASADDPVEAVIPPGSRWTPGPGVLVRTARTDGEVLTDRRGFRLTARTRTGLDLIRRGPLDEAVVLLDRLVAAGVVDLVGVRDAAEALPRGRGSAQARKVARLADGCAASPQETRLRLLLLRAGLPVPVSQFRVFDDDGFVARVDFAYPELKIAIEYDGVWHGEPGQFAKDRRRLNRLTAAGWRVIFVTAADLHRPEQFVLRLRAVMCR
jgi:G:T-mismatch repair DNA endonuclease (very short patch repair protein)